MVMFAKRVEILIFFFAVVNNIFSSLTTFFLA